MLASLVSACAAAKSERSTPGAESPAGLPAARGGSADPPRVLSTVPPNEVYLRHWGTHPTIDTAEEDTSSFAVDADTASYRFARARLRTGSLPEPAAVRVEEFINAFTYDYEPPAAVGLSVWAQAFPSPFRPGYHVLVLGLQGRLVPAEERVPVQLVLVVDLSRSMALDGRLAAVKAALARLVAELGPKDSVAIVSFADRALLPLPLTPISDAAAIHAVIDKLEIQGDSDLGVGLTLAYEVAEGAPAHGERRILLLSDGVADRGLRDAREILDHVGPKRRRGIALSTVGVGARHYDDVMLEQLADLGDGEYFHLDGPEEARRVFATELTRTLQLVAKDVKVQLEFDPEVVSRFRLLGYENRELAHHEVHDDRIDGGELGAGAATTALYELKLRRTDRALGELRVRFWDPLGAQPRLVLRELEPSLIRSPFDRASAGARLATFVAGFAEKLRGSYWARTIGYEALLEGIRSLPEPVRRGPAVLELIQLIEDARRIDQRADRFEAEMPLATMSFDEVPILR